MAVSRFNMSRRVAVSASCLASLSRSSSRSAFSLSTMSSSSAMRSMRFWRYLRAARVLRRLLRTTAGSSLSVAGMRAGSVDGTGREDTVLPASMLGIPLKMGD